MQVGRYRILRTIGRGGMAEVFEAVALGESGFERRVALKRILPGRETDPSFLRMFLDEARIASRLHHSNVVAVLDFGVVDGLPFQVLELVEGTDLRTLLRLGVHAEAPLPVELALHVCTEVAHALDHAHRAVDAEGRALGIVHRDVSPSNVLVSWGGEVKLADFGIAFARDRQEETRTGVTKGKLLYSAPEQVLRGEVDPRTDVFALGCVLHELVAGASALAGDDRMRDLLVGEPLDLDPGLPEDVRRIVERAVRREKAERWPTAMAMAEAVGRALADRLDRDAKSAMREWIERVRPVEPSPPRGQLDELLNAELVLGGASEGVRRFESVRHVPTRAASPGALAAAQPAGSPPSRRRRGWIVAAVLGVALIGVGVWQLAAWRLDTRTAALDGTKPVLTAMRDVGSASPASPMTAPPGLTTVPEDRAEERASTPARPGSKRRGATRSASDREEAGATPVDPSGVSGGGSGFLVIGGEGAHRAEILVDGRSRGYAPKSIELPLGEYSVELVTPDGRRLGPRRIAITARHTPSAPARWRVGTSP